MEPLKIACLLLILFGVVLIAFPQLYPASASLGLLTIAIQNSTFTVDVNTVLGVISVTLGLLSYMRVRGR